MLPAKSPRLVDSSIMAGRVTLVPFSEYKTKVCVQVKLPGREVLVSPMCFDLDVWTKAQIVNSQTIQEWLIRRTGASPRVVWEI